MRILHGDTGNLLPANRAVTAACCLAWMLGAISTSFGDRYVSPTGGNQPPYTNWAMAAQEIQDAIDVASVGETVWVTNGIYETGGKAISPGPTNRVAIDKIMRVESVNGPEVTVIRGAEVPGVDNDIRGVFMTNGATLAGFTIEFGSTETTGTSPAPVETSGGGIFAHIPGPLDLFPPVLTNVVSNCVIRHNRSWQGGGTYGADLIQCMVISNSASYGGGTYDGTVDRSWIMFNNAELQGGGTHGSDATGTMIIGNISLGTGGGAYDGHLSRCTVTRNSSSSLAARGGGLKAVHAYECIVYYNDTQGEVSNSTVPETLNRCYIEPAVGNNFSADPLLASPLNGHLLAGSPCIDTSTSGSGSGDDIDGDSVPMGLAVDIGADEFNSGSATGVLDISIYASATNAVMGLPISLSLEVDGIPLGHQVDTGDGTIYSNRSRFTHAYSEPGSHTVTAAVSNNTHVAFATIAIQIAPTNTTYFVSPTGGHVFPFDSWDNASTTIQQAVDAAVHGATVLVTNGVYATGGRSFTNTSLTNIVVITNAVQLRSVNGAAFTFIGASNQMVARGVYLGDGGLLEGFTVRNLRTLTTFGHDPLDMSGGGILCENTNATIRGCTITGCTAQRSGGGIYRGSIEDSVIISNTLDYGSQKKGGGAASAVLKRCRIAYNGHIYADYGGGLDTCTAYDSIIEHNSSYDGGGASFSWLIRCIVRHNSAFYRGGGMYSYGAADSLIYSNSAPNIGGMDFGIATNCTIMLNNGGGTRYIRAYNSIIYDNDGGNIDSPILVQHCCTTPDTGISCITNNPLVLDTASENFRLATNSPCINAGTNRPGLSGSTDLDGNPRIHDGTVDIGAYEYPSYTSNGILRAWLNEHGLANDGSADTQDTDLDGMNVLGEWVAGTNPTNPASFFTVADYTVSPSAPGEASTLKWSYENHRVYTVCWSDSPMGPDMVWSSLELTPGDYQVNGTTAIWQDTMPDSPISNRTYLIKVRRQ